MFFSVCSFWNPPSRRNTGEQHGRELQQIIVFTFLDHFRRFFQWNARECSVRGKGLAILIWFRRIVQTISQVLQRNLYCPRIYEWTDKVTQRRADAAVLDMEIRWEGIN
jgi:hypothetical protein